MIEPNNVYILINTASLTVLDLSGGSPADNTPCQGWQNLSDVILTFGQQWLVMAVQGQNDVFTLRNLRGGTYLNMNGGSSADGTQVQGYSKAPQGYEKNQQWRIISDGANYRLQNVAGANYLDLHGGLSANGTKVQGYQRVDTAGQRWNFKRISRAGHEVETLVKQNPYIGLNFNSYLQDGLYIVLPKTVRNDIYNNTGLVRTSWRDEIFDCDDFAFVAKAAIAKWGSDYLRADGFGILFGIMFGNNVTGGHAYNWYLTEDLKSIMFFEPQDGSERANIGYTGYFAVF